MDATLEQFERTSTVERTLAGLGAGVMAAGASVIWYFDPSKGGLLPVCPLYALTGFACPGCGLTRGFHALFHGDIAKALDHNALLPFFALLIGFAFVSMLFLALRGRRVPITLLHPTGLWVFFVMLISFGVLRNLPFYPFTILFP